MKSLCLAAISCCLIAMMLRMPASAHTQDGQYLMPDRAELAQFLDSLVPVKLQETKAPCLVISVMTGDGILFEKGYGYADLENNVPAGAETTVWRLASISKVVTGTAVMQLVEEGTLDPDRDVNDYLKDIRIPEKFGRPVTLRHLLTHTAGFDDRYIGKSFRTRDELPPLRDFIRNIMPQRVHPPGEVYTYSNIGNALMAVVVEDVTGTDFNDYCIRHIFGPLGMDQTSFRLTPQLAENLYNGYLYEGGSYTEIPFDFLGDYPAGQLLATADEFSRFMMCHLNLGILDSVRILETETARAMHSAQFTHHPELNGSVGYTFHISKDYGHTIISHNGGYLGLSTTMWLMPGLNTGLFMATNVMDFSIINSVRNPLMERFFARSQEYGDESAYPPDRLPAYDRDVEKFTGWYRSTRYSREDITKTGLLMGFGGEVRIWKNDEGMLMMYDHKGDVRRLIQVEPGLFRSIDDDYYIAFHFDESGNPDFLFTSGTDALERFPAFYRPANQMNLMAALFGFFLLVLLVRIFYLIVPKKFKRSTPLPTAARNTRRWSNLTAAFFILHPVAMAVALFVLNPQWELMVGMAYGVPPGMYAAQLLPMAAAVALVLTAIYYFTAIKRRALSTGAGLFYGLFLATGIFYLWLLNYWNLLGYQFGA